MNYKQLLLDAEGALRLLIEDNRRRGLSGADVNWAAIHYASGVLKQVEQAEAALES